MLENKDAFRLMGVLPDSLESSSLKIPFNEPREFLWSYYSKIGGPKYSQTTHSYYRAIRTKPTKTGVGRLVSIN